MWMPDMQNTFDLWRQRDWNSEEAPAPPPQPMLVQKGALLDQSLPVLFPCEFATTATLRAALQSWPGKGS